MAPSRTGPYHVLPVLHERLEFADWVRRTCAELQPDALAVEIPSSLERAWLRAVRRLPRISVLLYENARGATVYLPVHPADPLVEAARTALERGLPLRCADLDVDGYADYRDPVPDSYALLRLGLTRLHDAFRAVPRPADPADRPREAALAWHAQQLHAQGASRVLVLCGMHHADAVERELQREQAQPLTPPARANVRLVHLHPDSLGEVLPEIPFYIAAYEARRRGLPAEPPRREDKSVGRDHGPFRVLDGGGGREAAARAQDAIARGARQASVRGQPWPLLDRLRLQWSLYREAEHGLGVTMPGESVAPWQRRLLARYTRNLALCSGQLVADLFDVVAAARGCVSEDYAWETHRLATAYPAQAAPATDLPTARIRAEELYDGVRRLRLERRIRRPKQGDWRRLLRARRSERVPGEWLEGFDGEAICSYPPEDIVIEDFGRYLRRRGRSVLSEAHARTVPFTTSVLDGIDVRETIRNWAERRIMVRELGRAPGEVGSVVVIFEDEPLAGSRYPHVQTWHGEHDQESDMAFYSTDPAQAIVGPGICRVTYGGFLLSYPPRRMLDAWTDPDYRLAESKAEVLLLAALDYCTERIVAHVAPQPPRAVLQQLALRLGLKLLYLPLGTISPATRRRIRVMHILHGHDKRDIARDYVW